MQRLGGPSALLQKGSNQALLSECAIADPEAEIVRSIGEEAVSDVLRRVGHKDFAAALYVLVELSVLSVATAERRTGRGGKRERERGHPAKARSSGLRAPCACAHLGAQSAERMRATTSALLGRRAQRHAATISGAPTPILKRRVRAASRIVTSETLDLREDVDLILEVLAEAYEILEDDLRRDRYRRALDASP